MRKQWYQRRVRETTKTLELKIFSGTANPQLATRIAHTLGQEVGLAKVGKFANGETSVQLFESCRDCDTFIVQPTCNPNVNDYLMELLVMADAMRRASASRITAVIPHFGYARQDKKDKSRAPITGKLVANLIQVAGIDRVITLDLHASQIQGFFDIPVDNLTAENLLSKYIRRLPGDIVIVSPDAGGVKRAKAISDHLDVPLVIIHKERKRANEVDAMTLVGDVKGMTCVIVDDMADTCGTLQLAAKTLMAQGAKAIYAAVSHGVLSGPALQRIEESEITELVVTDSIPQEENVQKCSKIRVIDIAPMMAEAIRRTHNGESVSVLFV
eukprot:TRINITY_DN1097_c0_g2_i4.p1 TRINITY_DN1097_c0_g2~~TRINITY_DN1097_c0_g2_i4.p1  ORF type:complete len:328 (-),score=76.11 TRINITY_DN1097_c0_g2_i4:667-1650(-)